MQPLGVVIIGGLSVSTLVTLVLIPTVYLIFNKIEKKLKGRFKGMSEKISNKFSRHDKKLEPKTISPNSNNSKEADNKIKDKDN